MLVIVSINEGWINITCIDSNWSKTDTHVTGDRQDRDTTIYIYIYIYSTHITYSQCTRCRYATNNVG